MSINLLDPENILSMLESLEKTRFKIRRDNIFN